MGRCGRQRCGRQRCVNKQPLLIQFAKSGTVGAVKTRLSPPLSALEAAQLHVAMVVHTCTTLCTANLGEVQLWLTGEHQQSLLERCRRLGRFSVHQQCSGDLGTRMAQAVEEGLSRHQRVILVGSDTPSIDAGYLRAAIQALDKVDVVLGPARDGGYVLVGLRRYAPELFQHIEWGSDAVLATTLERVRGLAWTLSLLDERVDIDRPEDLAHLPASLTQAEMLVS